MPRHFITLPDYTREELVDILDRAAAFKKKPIQPLLHNRVLGLIFSKSSTRTRVSFEVAVMHLGGNSIFMSSRDIQTGRGESFADTARVLSRYLDIIAMRVHDHNDILEMAASSDIPVINGLSDQVHPCQVMADLLTVREKLRTVRDFKIAYIGDGANNMAYTWIDAARLFGFELAVASPKGYQPVVKKLPENVSITADPMKAARGADVLYTDVWVSMGQEEEMKKRLKDLKNYQINTALLGAASKRAVVMHCLPAHRGQEITSDVMDGRRSVIFDQAENRLHVNKALFALLLKA